MGEKKKPNGCAIGCMVAVAVFLVLFIAGMVYGCNSNSQEKGWVEQLKQEKQEAEQLYAIDIPPEEKAAQAREKMVALEDEFTAIQDETGKNQMDYPLIRAYVCVREMYVAIKHMAENDEYDKYYSEYFQANSEATQILNNKYGSY